MGLLLKPGTQKHLRELHDEGNLLFFTMHVVSMEKVIKVTAHACIFLNVLWKNVIWRCEEKENDQYHKVVFPTENLHYIYEIGFPKDD